MTQMLKLSKKVFSSRKFRHWISNGDVMLVNQIEWLQYRQDLRDITLQEGYPYEIDWPQKPETTHSTPIDTRINSLKRQES